MLEKAKLFDWIGGKKWLANDLCSILEQNLPKTNVKYYLEPFAGGLGSALFSLETLNKEGIETIYLNDINSTIISIYKTIKSDPTELFDAYWKLEEEYQTFVPESSIGLKKTRDKLVLRPLLEPARDFYMAKREEFNNLKSIEPNSLRTLSLFLFLAKHCFNGVYRENNSGGYNSPFNWEQGIVDRENAWLKFQEHHKVFNDFNIVFENMSAFDFIEKYKHLKEEALFYFDPPYLNKDISENKYNKDHFGLTQQKELLMQIESLPYTMFSNHLLPIFEEFCERHYFTYKTIERINRMASNKKDSAASVPEILAYRFK